MNNSRNFNLSVVSALLFTLSACSQDEVSSEANNDKVVLVDSQEVDVNQFDANVELQKKSESIEVYEDSVNEETINTELEPTDDLVSQEGQYAGEEFYPSDPEFSPEVQEAIDTMNGAVRAPGKAPELKEDYKNVAEKLEQQITNY